MPKKVDQPVTSQPNVILPMEVALSAGQVKYLASMVSGDNQEPEIRKAQSVILRLIDDQTAGGLMLNVREVKRITDSTGLDPSCGEDLLPFLQAGTGRTDGCLTVPVKVDPAYEPGLQDIATVRGTDIAGVLRDTVHMVLDNSWYEHLPVQPAHIMMTEADHAGMQELLGGKFTNGTELAALIRKALNTEGGIFNEPEPAAEMVQ